MPLCMMICFKDVINIVREWCGKPEYWPVVVFKWRDPNRVPTAYSITINQGRLNFTYVRNSRFYAGAFFLVKINRVYT